MDNIITILEKIKDIDNLLYEISELANKVVNTDSNFILTINEIDDLPIKKNIISIPHSIGREIVSSLSCGMSVNPVTAEIETGINSSELLIILHQINIFKKVERDNLIKELKELGVEFKTKKYKLK